MLILEKEKVFPFLMLSAKQGNFWYYFFNVFGMIRFLTGDWTRDLTNLEPALYHYCYAIILDLTFKQMIFISEDSFMIVNTYSAYVCRPPCIKSTLYTTFLNNTHAISFKWYS